MKFVLLYMFGVHFSTNKAHITIHKFSLIFGYKRGCVPYLKTSFGFVFINSRLDATRRIFTLGSTYQFRILFGVRFIWPHFGLLYVLIKIVI